MILDSQEGGVRICLDRRICLNTHLSLYPSIVITALSFCLSEFGGPEMLRVMMVWKDTRKIGRLYAWPELELLASGRSPLLCL